MDPRFLADFFGSFGADGAQSHLPWNIEGELAGPGRGFGEGLRIAANGREWRVLEVGVAEDDMDQPPYRSDSQLRDAARVLPPVCFAPLVSQYTRLLRDPRWAVQDVPRIMSAMLHDPVLFHVMDANPLAPLSDYRVTAMTRWWGVVAKPALRYDYNSGRPLRGVVEETGTETEEEVQQQQRSSGRPTGIGEAEECSTVNEDEEDVAAAGCPRDRRMPFEELRQRYRDIKTVLTLIVATSAPYRCSRPANAAVSGCTARLVFCKDPSIIYLGLLLNTVLRELPRKVLCSMSVFRLIAEGWGNSPSLQAILQAAWEDYQDTVEEIRVLLRAGTAAAAAATEEEGENSASASARASPTAVPTPAVEYQLCQPQQQHRPRRSPPHLRFPSQPHESAEDSQTTTSATSSSFGATAAVSENGQPVEFGIPLGRERVSATRAGASNVFAPNSFDAFQQRFDGLGRRFGGSGVSESVFRAARTPPSLVTADTAAGGATSAAAGDRRNPAAAGTTTPPPTTTATDASADSSNATYRTQDADRICLESMRECAQSPELLLWWARCRLLAYQLLDSSARVSVESTRALEFFRQLWSCAPLVREILEDDHEALLSASLDVEKTTTPASHERGSSEVGPAAAAEAEEQSQGEKGTPVRATRHAEATKALEALQRRARRLYAALVGTVADVSKFWFSIRVAQSTLNAVSSSAPENNVVWSIVNATVPPRRRFQREEFSSYAEHWQYALLVDDYVTQPMGFCVSMRGRTMVTQLLHVLSSYPTFYPALVTRTLAMLNRREMFVAELNGRLVAAVTRCLRFYLPPMPPVQPIPPAVVAPPAVTNSTTSTTATASPSPTTADGTRDHRGAAAASSASSPPSASPASSISTYYSPPSEHLDADGPATDTVSAQPAESNGHAAASATEAVAEGRETANVNGADASSSGLNYEAYILSDTDVEASAGDDDDEEGGIHNASSAHRSGRHDAGDAGKEEDGERELERHPRLRRRAAKKAALARLEALRRRQEAAMPVLTTKAYDAILTCLDVLRMLVRHTHVSVNPIGVLFTAPTSTATTAATTAAEAAGASPSSTGPVPDPAPPASSPPQAAEGVPNRAADATVGVTSDATGSANRGNPSDDLCRHRRESRYEPSPFKPQSDLYTLLHQLVQQTRYGPLAMAALRFFSACVHYNVRDMVPLFTERGLLNTVLAIARRPCPSSVPPPPPQLSMRDRSHRSQRHEHYTSSVVSGAASAPAAAAAPAEAAMPALWFALDSLEETGLPNIPSRDASPPSAAALAAEASPDSNASIWQCPLLTADPPPSLLVRYIPQEDPYLNTVSVRMVLPEFVEAMTVHQATHAVFRKHLQWIPASLDGLVVTAPLSTSTPADIRALWEDEEWETLAEGGDPSHLAEAMNEEEGRSSGGAREKAVRQRQQQRAQLECRSSVTYKRLLRSLLASRNASRLWERHSSPHSETARPTTDAAPQQGVPLVSTQAVDASLIRLVELCRLNLKREEVGYKILQGSVKDMSRVLTEVLQPSTELMDKLKPALHHQLAQLDTRVWQFADAVRAGATRAKPFAPSSYGPSASAAVTFPRNFSTASSDDAPLHASTSSAEVKRRPRRVFPASRDDFFQLLVRAMELCRSFNNFFAFFSGMDWTGQRRGPRLARNSAERQEGMQALRDVLNGTVEKFHRAIRRLWSLMGCQIPLDLRGTPLHICELGTADGEGSLLSYVQVVIGQGIHPRILSDYLRSTQPSPVLEAVLRSTVRCILHHSTRSLFHLHSPAVSTAATQNTKAAPTTTADNSGETNPQSMAQQAFWMEAEDAEKRDTLLSDQSFRQAELRRLLRATDAQSSVQGVPEACNSARGEAEAQTGLSTNAAAAALGEGHGSAEAPATRPVEQPPSGWRVDPSDVTAASPEAEAIRHEPVLVESTGYPCYDCVSNVLRPLSMGDGIFLRQLLEAWRATAASSSNTSTINVAGFGAVAGGPNRRDADGAQWRGVFGDVLHHVVDAAIVRAPLSCDDVPNLLRSLRSGGGVHAGTTSALLSLYDRSAEAGTAFSDGTSGGGRSPAAAATGGGRDVPADPSDQLMRFLLQDNRNYVSEPATAWMTAEAWRVATMEVDASSGGSAPASAATGAGLTEQQRAGTALRPLRTSSDGTTTAAAGVSAFSPGSPPASGTSPPPSQSPPAETAFASGLEDVALRVESEEAGFNALRLAISSSTSPSPSSAVLTPTPQTTSAGVPAHLTAGGAGVPAEEGPGFLPARTTENAADRPIDAPPLFVPLDPMKALQQWIFMTLFNGRRRGMTQVMDSFSHITTYRSDSRTRAMLPLNVSALQRTVQADLVAAFERAVCGAYADALTREQCHSQTAAIRASEPEKYARAVDEIVATRRHWRAAAASPCGCSA
ncbi:putative ubiquitin-protein ligase [Leptomonas pyrrhocoris]|uniref:Putative ubiquitin-protein ligase n=1 Tax=Leptomonas pyrrhocoris TaxID=157538 RepID=A0A0N0DRF4_LEPPY|nr:putative ubiquitin-protein ligase [Leptomonas pyrrhocoris]KPA74372.1 putative ubiquitin-protein ligase [Leptomonas pyrrhocoris]|eukprot:XP_015652811.1 putative ubiquitin-protein ligase [Leptomonas pyrrhocoris]